MQKFHLRRMSRNGKPKSVSKAKSYSSNTSNISRSRSRSKSRKGPVISIHKNLQHSLGRHDYQLSASSQFGQSKQRLNLTQKDVPSSPRSHYASRDRSRERQDKHDRVARRKDAYNKKDLESIYLGSQQTKKHKTYKEIKRAKGNFVAKNKDMIKEIQEKGKVRRFQGV